jgi:hypothetical protein
MLADPKEKENSQSREELQDAVGNSQKERTGRSISEMDDMLQIVVEIPRGYVPSRRERIQMLRYRATRVLRREYREYRLLLRLIRSEMGSLLSRIALLCRVPRGLLYGLDLGRASQPSPTEYPVPHIRTRACSDHIKTFCNSHPWATLIDENLYRDAWYAGTQWGACNPDSCNEEPNIQSLLS